MAGFNRKELEEKMLQLDLYLGEILENKSDKVLLLIIGGASLIINNLTDRAVTSDIDTFVADPADMKLDSFENIFGPEIEEEISTKFDINSDVYFFKLKQIIVDLEMEYIKFKEKSILNNLKYLDIFTLDVEGIVLTKLLVMMEEDPEREDRDYIDIKGLVNKVDHKKLNEYINKWKENHAKRNQIEKFDKAFGRWKNTAN